MRSYSVVITLLCFSLLSVVPAAYATEPAPQFEANPKQMSPAEREAERERIRRLNKQRQQKLQADTDRLLQLATELKQYVDRTNEDILSVEVIKKTQEIEKLSKSIRDKMKNAYDVPRDVEFPPR